MAIVGWILLALGVYGAIGVCFASWFVFAGVGRISPAARGTGFAFRLLILPGSAALWPLLVWELVASGGAGGIVVGRALSADDLETAMEAPTATDADDPETRLVDPEAETTA